MADEVMDGLFKKQAKILEAMEAIGSYGEEELEQLEELQKEHEKVFQAIVDRVKTRKREFYND